MDHSTLKLKSVVNADRFFLIKGEPLGNDASHFEFHTSTRYYNAHTLRYDFRTEPMAVNRARCKYVVRVLEFSDTFSFSNRLEQY